jgi:hypothetical protein
LERDIAAAGPRLAEARRREAEATVFALAQLNNRASEGRAIATMLAFAPERPVTAAELDDPFRYSAVPGVQSAPGNPLQVASLTAPFAPPREPTSSPPLSLARPAPSDLVDAKLAVLQWAANGWQQDLRELPQLRAAVPNKRAEHSSLQGQADALGNSLFGLDMRANQLRAELQGANARIDVALANAAGSNAVALKEILADVVLDTAAERMRAIAEEIAGAAGIDIPAPPTEARQFLDYVRRGGRVLLPIEGYAQQWEAFNDAQQLALDGLGKTQGFISEAAQVLATGSVSETLALAERVFATVEWQAFDYFKTTGLSGLPDDEDKPAVVDWLERYADKRRAQETGG